MNRYLSRLYTTGQCKNQQPWFMCYENMVKRCKNLKNPFYGGKGIKCELTFWELGVLYYKFNADKMNKPSIDRIDSAKNYTMDNCRFIEMKENSKSFTGKKHSIQTINKIIESNKKRIYSQETLNKMSEGSKKAEILKIKGIDGRYIKKEKSCLMN